MLVIDDGLADLLARHIYWQALLEYILFSHDKYQIAFMSKQLTVVKILKNKKISLKY